MLNINEYFESIVSGDCCNIVICDLNHKIIYMNTAAITSYGNLVGSSILNCHNEKSREMILKVVEWFGKSENNNRVHTFFNEKQNKDGYMIALRNKDGILIGYYEKHEFRTKDNSPFYSLQ